MSKHVLLMLACCLIPLALIVAMPATGPNLGPAAPLLVLLCPLMHVLMMVFIGHDCRRDSREGAVGSEHGGRPVCSPKPASAEAPSPR